MNSEYYYDGSIRQTGFTRDGMREGVWTTYWHTGVTCMKTTYKHNKRHGPFTIWNLSGEKLYQSHYVNDCECPKRD
jgi:antitoxin component YwqK of YwqJK toxin-antitoxin module